MKTSASKEIISLDYMETFEERSLQALENGSGAAIFGPEGAGTTLMLRSIQSAWIQRNAGQVLFLTCCRESDHVKAVQHLASMVLRDKMPTDWRVHCSSNLMHLITQTIQNSGTGLIIIDRADLAPADFIDALMTAASNCSDIGSPVGVLLGIRESGRQLPLFREISSTCISFLGQILPLNYHEVAEVISELAPSVSEIKELVVAKSQTGISASEAVASLSRGNFRRLAQFARHLESLDKAIPITGKAMDSQWKNAFGESLTRKAA